MARGRPGNGEIGDGRRKRDFTARPTSGSGRLRRPSARRCLRAVKLKVSYTLNDADTVTFTLKLKAPGRKVNGKCVKPTNNNRHKERCTRVISVDGQLVKIGHAGANSFSFNGKIAGHKLAPGTYQLTASPTAGTPKTFTFTIVG
jgi:hypothetical protein